MSILSLLKKVFPVAIVNSLENSSFYKAYHEHYLKNRQSVSQAGQDYWVINEVFAQKKQGYFVEIGSADGIIINNTYLLEKCYQWKGICIEANPNLFRQLKVNRNCICLNLCVDQQEGEVDFVLSGFMGGILDKDTDMGSKKDNYAPNSEKRIKLKTTTLANILKEHQAPKIIDYLSIDVEGAETRILQDFPFKDYTFLSLTIERPSNTLHEILLNNDYILVKIIPGLDSFYIHRSFREDYLKSQKQFYIELRRTENKQNRIT